LITTMTWPMMPTHTRCGNFPPKCAGVWARMLSCNAVSLHVCAFGSECPILPPNDFRKASQRAFGIHSKISIYEPPVVYYLLDRRSEERRVGKEWISR